MRIEDERVRHVLRTSDDVICSAAILAQVVHVRRRSINDDNDTLVMVANHCRTFRRQPSEGPSQSLV